MIVTTVMVQVKPEHIREFILATIANHDASIKEPGNRRFDICQSADDPAHFLLYEAYDTEKAAKAHRETAHYIKWRDAVAPYMAKPREGIHYEALRPK